MIPQIDDLVKVLCNDVHYNDVWCRVVRLNLDFDYVIIEHEGLRYRVHIGNIVSTRRL